MDRLINCLKIGYYAWQAGECQHWDFEHFMKTNEKIYPRCKGRLDCEECDPEHIKEWEILSKHWSG